MYNDIFKKSRKIPRKVAVLSTLTGILMVLLSIVATAKWLQRPIVIVRISEFSLIGEIEELNLGGQIKNPDLALSIPRIHGSLIIKIENIGRSSAENITLRFLAQRCKLGKLQIYKTDSDCEVNIAKPQDYGYDISVRELRPGSEVQLKYIIYKEGESRPSFKFGKISSSNAKIKIFYLNAKQNLNSL